MDKITVLVTGGVGFIGSHTVNLLTEQGYNVIVIDKIEKYNNTTDNIIYYKKNLTDNSVEEVFQKHHIDYVIHLAAQPSVTTSISNPQQDCMDNYLSTINICCLAKKYNIKKLIFSSTAAVYASPEYLPVDEKHTTKFLSPYAVSKNACENYIKISGLDYIIFRYSNVYGPGQNSKGEAGVVAIFYDAMIKNSSINIFGDGEQIRDFVFVKDVAKANVEAIKSQVKNEIINVSTNSKTTINELFRIMKNLLVYQKAPNYLPQREGDIKESILSNEKLKKMLKFEPKISIKEGLKEMKELLVGDIDVQ